ncbi:MAG: YicC family protein [Clostridia bacterium]|nr:YicC family protein [Clostridia bacterium]
MIKSMTGYGRGKYENDGRNYIVEIKSVNHKYSEVSIRLPRTLSFLEEKIKKTVSNSINRGKIDVSVTFVNLSDKGINININKELAKQYLAEIQNLATETELRGAISVMDITRLPEVLTIENNEDEDLLWGELECALNEALENFTEMRKQEGASIAKDLEARANLIEEKTKMISELSAGLVEEYIAKLEARIKELLKTDVVDQARLAQEVVIYSDKCSVQEELTRLASHIAQFKNTIKKDGPCGKNLDFIVQEMNRETNTIGSKANKLEITNLVIETKTIIEDIREQIQNIE